MSTKINVSQIIIHLIFIFFCLLCIIPIIVIVSISLSNSQDIISFGYRLIPVKIDLSAYKLIFNDASLIGNGYLVTIFVTIVGTSLSLVLNSLIAYPLSRKEFASRNIINFFIFFPMLFGGGLVPWYIFISRTLHLSNTIWVLIVPSLASSWNILLLRTYFSKVDVGILESATIDGANEFQILLKILIPISKPALATVGFLTSLIYWNDWWLSLLFIDNEKLYPLQYLLQRIMANTNYLVNTASKFVEIDTSKLPTESLRMAMCVLAAGPMIFAFQFFQKYFVKGLTIGAIKG